MLGLFIERNSSDNLFSAMLDLDRKLGNGGCGSDVWWNVRSKLLGSVKLDLPARAARHPS